MIERLLSPAVVAEEAHGDLPESYLFPEERVLVASAVAKRRAEFGTVRACARTALGRLGIAPVPILPGLRGAPVWPDGIVGSMTHCDGYRAAAVARSADLVTVGLDAEPNGPLPSDGVRDMVTVAEERDWLGVLGARHPEVSWDRLVFSAKESLYKAWFPLTGRWLDFDQAVITVDPEATVFTARLLVPGPVVDGVELREFTGRWQVRQGLLLTAIDVTRQAVRDRSGAAEQARHEGAA